MCGSGETEPGEQPNAGKKLFPSEHRDTPRRRRREGGASSVTVGQVAEQQKLLSFVVSVWLTCIEVVPYSAGAHANVTRRFSCRLATLGRPSHPGHVCPNYIAMNLGQECPNYDRHAWFVVLLVGSSPSLMLGSKKISTRNGRPTLRHSRIGDFPPWPDRAVHHPFTFVVRHRSPDRIMRQRPVAAGLRSRRQGDGPLLQCSTLVNPPMSPLIHAFAVRKPILPGTLRPRTGPRSITTRDFGQSRPRLNCGH